MTPIIVCECGTVVRGDTERELLLGARGHMEANHPAVATQITDDELLALSQDDGLATEEA
jgi:predicted small metal-binding protein